MFFDRFREALSRLPDGLVRTGPPASPAALAEAEAALGRPLPGPLRSFLQSFDGADLFHEAVVIASAGAGDTGTLTELNRARAPEPLVFAEAAGGDRFALRADGAVLRLRAGDEESEPERWLAGSDFERWLEALVAHERVLYGPDGEWAPDAFEPDGAEILPLVALRQAERALKIDPGGAELHHARAVALRRLDRQVDARQAFARAAALDPDNPWTWFDLGRAALAEGVPGARDALAAFERAARSEGGQAGARFWIWAARAAQLVALPERLAACRQEALALVPELGGALRRACDAAAAGDDPDALAEAEALLAALEAPIGPARSRLNVLSGPTPPSSSKPAPTPPPAKDATTTAKRAPAPQKKTALRQSPKSRAKRKPRR